MKMAATICIIAFLTILSVSVFTIAMLNEFELPTKKSSDDANSSSVVVSLESPPSGLGSVPMQDPKSNYRFNKDGDNDLGGQSHLPGGSINWRSESVAGDGEGATPSLVVQATIDRLSFLQQTAQANGVNAKALFKLMEAKDIFDGESVELSEIHSNEGKK